MRYGDFHTHSTFSDGTLTPEEIVEHAIECGLSAVALCDHNTTSGLTRFLRAAANRPIEAIAGAEFSVDYEGKELHLLAMHIPPQSFEPLEEMMCEIVRLKDESNRTLAAALAEAGYPFDYETLKAASPNGQINRAPIAKELTRLGYTASTEEAFATLLSEDGGYYHPPKRITVWEMLNIIQVLDAVPVLAHPLLNLSKEELLTFLPKAVERGLVGMEVMYSTYTPDEELIATSLAETFGLKPSGGSDFHGENKPKIALGTGLGNLRIPAVWGENLKA